MKISSKIKDSRLQLKIKLSGTEGVDEKMLDRFARANLRGFLKPVSVGKNNVEYSGPVGVALADRFKREISKREVLFIMENIVVAVQKLQANKFPLLYMRMDLKKYLLQ